MKTSITVVVTTIAVAWISGATAFAAESLDLSVFKGRYTGPATLSGPAGNRSGRAFVNLPVPASGKSARVGYRAAFSDGFGTDVFPTQFILSANKRVSVSDLLVGIAGTNNAKPGEGRWVQRGRTLRFKADNGEGISLRANASVRDRSNRRVLVLTLVSNDGGGANTFRANLRSRLP